MRRTARPPKTPASVALAIAAATAGVLPVFLTGALGVQLRRGLHLGSTDIGIAVTAFFASSALCSITAGRLAERVGALKMMRWAALIALASMVGLGALVHALWSLALLLVLGGISNGTMQPAVNLFLSDNVRTRRQGLAFGVKQAGIPTATLLSGLAVPALAITVGWQAAYLAAAAVVAGVTAMLFVWRSPVSATRAPAPNGAALYSGEDRRTGGLAPGEPAVGCRGNPDVPTLGIGAGGIASRAGAALELRPLVLMAAGMACAVAAANALGSFVVPSAVDHGVAAGSAGLLSALGSVVGFSTRVGQGWRADSGVHEGVPAALRHLGTVAVMIGIGILGYLALASGVHALLVPGVLLAYGAGWGFNGLFNLAVVRAYPHAPGRATGVTQVGTYIGGMLGPLGFGLLVDHAGYGAGWTMCAIAAAAGATTLLIARCTLAKGASRGDGTPASGEQVVGFLHGS